MKFRKRPVVIEAFQMTKERRWDNSEWPQWLHDAWQRNPGAGGCIWAEPNASGVKEKLLCCTLSGIVRIDWDDWIIKGVAGELYPCEPYIFEATYERVEE